MADEQSNTVEEWRPAVGYESVYEVSSHGRVRRTNPRSKAKIGLPLAPRDNGRGYLYVCLCVESQTTYKYIHRLVAAAFIGAPPEGFEVNHKDGIKANNRVENLEYLTPAQNVEHAIKNGLVGKRRKVERVPKRTTKGKWIHRLSDINSEARTALCSNCGIVRTRLKGKRSPRCAVSQARWDGNGTRRNKDTS